MVKKTFILLKPDAIERHLEPIIFAFIERHGFRVLHQQSVRATATKIVKHYDEVIRRIGVKSFKPKVLKEFVDQPIIIAVCEHPTADAITLMRQLIGATDPLLAKKDTIRGQYGIDTLSLSRQEDRMLRNLIHASETLEDAKREINLWFDGETCKTFYP